MYIAIVCTLSTAPPPTEVPDPVYVYDHRGLRVKKDSLPSSETGNELETTPTIVLDPQEEGIMSYIHLLYIYMYIHIMCTIHYNL